MCVFRKFTNSRYNDKITSIRRHRIGRIYAEMLFSRIEINSIVAFIKPAILESREEQLLLYSKGMHSVRFFSFVSRVFACSSNFHIITCFYIREESQIEMLPSRARFCFEGKTEAPVSFQSIESL